MNRIFTLLAIIIITITSCEKYDEDFFQITGIYDARVVGLTGPHDIGISYDNGDNIVIEAPFDGFVWIAVYADVDNQDEAVKQIDIHWQEIGPGIFIEGEGAYLNGSLQLDYTIDFTTEIIDFRIVGSQL